MPKLPSPTSLRTVYDLVPTAGTGAGGGGPWSYTTSPLRIKLPDPVLDAAADVLELAVAGELDEDDEPC